MRTFASKLSLRNLLIRGSVAALMLVAAACGGSGGTSLMPDQDGLVANDAVVGPRVELQTTHGDIVISLNSEKAPLTVENFLNYVDSGHYNGTIFHRVIDGFMIQGGGFTEAFDLKTTLDPVANEADNGLKNSRYTIAMARTTDPQSATSQFFINVADNTFLDYSAPSAAGWGYAVFGKVTAGMDVVDAIKGLSTGADGPFTKDVPSEAVVIISATRLN